MDRYHGVHLKLEMEEALQMGKLEIAVSHLDTMLSSAPPLSSETRNLLANHVIKDLPTLHHLAHLTFQKEDIPHLDKLIRTFTDAGYDINKRCQVPRARRTGFTALLESIRDQNMIMVDCLLRHGARTDIRDDCGFSPAHWAIKVCKVKCLEKLVQVGGPSVLATTSIEKTGENDVHPLLHTAADQNRLEMVVYLLKNEVYGVDVNEEGTYKNLLSTDIFDKSSSRVDKAFTPLGRALHNKTIPIIDALCALPGAKLSRFTELNSLLKGGDTEKALDFLKYFSDEELSTHKVQDRWALHSINHLAFSHERYAEFTKKLILEYVGRGWDANSLSPVKLDYKTSALPKLEWSVYLRQHNLLHLACLHGRLEIIKALVEGAKVDVNYKAIEKMAMTPLQILLMSKQWEGAKYLIERGADLNARGSLSKRNSERRPFTRFMRKKPGTARNVFDSTFNSVELLIRMGKDEGLPLLDKVLARRDVVWDGGNEFHLALEGGNPRYILKVLNKCSKIISKRDLTWVTYWEKNERYSEKLPSIIWLLTKLGERNSEFKHQLTVDELSEIIKLLVKVGCALNISWKKPHRLGLGSGMEPLIFYILRYDLLHSPTNLLLKTILQFDHLQLNVANGRGLNCVNYLMEEWNHRCFHHTTSICANVTDGQQPSIVGAIQILVTHGLDASGMVIGPPFVFHKGTKSILELLCHAGATISDELFTSASVCRRASGGSADEIAEWKNWKENFDRETKLTLKHICGLRVRKMMKQRVRDLKLLDEVPKDLKERVLGTAYL